jgi:hypothetical protein
VIIIKIAGFVMLCIFISLSFGLVGWLSQPLGGRHRRPYSDPHDEPDVHLDLTSPSPVNFSRPYKKEDIKL